MAFSDPNTECCVNGGMFGMFGGGGDGALLFNADWVLQDNIECTYL
jgi:hypothetical protein